MVRPGPVLRVFSPRQLSKLWFFFFFIVLNVISHALAERKAWLVSSRAAYLLLLFFPRFLFINRSFGTVLTGLLRD